MVPNVFGGKDEIEQLRAEGIEVDDDNEPLPDEAIAPLEPLAMFSYGKPTFCPRRVDRMPNNKGNWINHRWDEIAAKSEFELFRLSQKSSSVMSSSPPRTFF